MLNYLNLSHLNPVTDLNITFRKIYFSPAIWPRARPLRGQQLEDQVHPRDPRVQTGGRAAIGRCGRSGGSGEQRREQQQQSGAVLGHGDQLMPQNKIFNLNSKGVDDALIFIYDVY